jgi:uncharacterized membrane protein YdfJ with MMPL/SSD domain
VSSPDPLNSVFDYYGRFQSARGRFTGLPPWARSVVFVVALPGILLVVLSILLLLVSILALLLLTVPVYMLLRRLVGGAAPEQEGATIVESAAMAADPGRKRVEATVVDPPE